MKFKVFLRPLLTVVLAFIGALVARIVTPPQVFSVTGEYFVVVAAAAFGLLGFILPEIVEFMGKAGISVLAKQIADYFPEPPNLRFGKSGKTKNKSLKNRYINPIVLDTSVLIDGRLKEVIKTGFLFGTFVVLPSVVDELHKLADSRDDLKRGKGRRGLETLSVLKKGKDIKLVILESEPNDKEVDSKLVSVSKKLKAKLLTLDYNLNKVGSVRGVAILNLNELTNAVKTAVLPHDSLTVKVNESGKEKDQGVGYLSDGTMVVVEGGEGYKGQSIRVKVLRVLQTAAGKMIFGKPSK